MPTAWAATGRPGGLEGGHGRLLAAVRPAGWPAPRGPGPASRRACPCHPAGSCPGTRTSSSTTSAVCEARMPIFLYFWPCDRPGVLGRHDEAGLAPAPELGIDGGHHHVDVGDAAVGDPRLGAVEHPLVVGLVVDGLGAQRRDVGAGVGLAHAEGAELHVVGRAVALGHPLDELLGGAVAHDAGRGQAAAHDGQADAGVAPEQLLDGHRHGQPGGVAEHGVGHEVEAVEADLGRLLHDRPRELLPLVPLLGGRADHGLGEVVDPLLDLELVLVEGQGKVGHAKHLAGPGCDRTPVVRRIRRISRSLPGAHVRGGHEVTDW